MTTTNRRYNIDWLRVIAIGFLLVYHIGIAFQPWGVFIGFIQSDESIDSLWVPMSMLNIWRIPLLFFVSGMGVCFAMRTRSWRQLLFERIRRILIPFLFGVVFIVPVHILIWQKYYNQDIKYSLVPSHLWFLANIFIYVILISPLVYYLKRNPIGTGRWWLKRIFSNPYGLILVAAAFVLEAVTVNPETYETYSMSLHGFLLGLLAFLFGFLMVYSGDEFWETVKKWNWLNLGIASLLFIFRYYRFDLQAPNILKAIESSFWVFTMFGFSYRFLNRPGKSLTYFSQAAYPVYIIHMIFLYFASYYIMPLDIPVVSKLILIVIITVSGCFITYDLIIRRINCIRPLFGLKSLI